MENVEIYLVAQIAGTTVLIGGIFDDKELAKAYISNQVDPEVWDTFEFSINEWNPIEL